MGGLVTDYMMADFDVASKGTSTGLLAHSSLLQI